MSNALHCFDQESKLEHFLVDSDSRFQSVVVEKGSVTIYVT
jgi:hypothetical protein